MAVTAIPLPIGIDARLVALYWDRGRMMPAASPGNPVPVGTPNPKARSAASKRLPPSRRAISIVPTFDDWRTTSATVIAVGCDSTSAYFVPSTTIDPGTDRVVDGVTIPASSAAAIVTTFAVDPGSNTSVSGRLRAMTGDGVAGSVPFGPSTLAMAR